MKKLTVLLSFVTIAVISFPIAQGAGGAQEKNNGSAEDALLQQAFDHGAKETIDYIVYCGGSSYGKRKLWGGEIVEIKGFGHLPFDEKKINNLTEADRLNGVEFDGRFIFEGSPTRRMKMSTGQWGGWENERVTIVARVLRKNGQWVITMSEGLYGGPMGLVKGFSCSQLPGAKK